MWSIFFFFFVILSAICLCMLLFELKIFTPITGYYVNKYFNYAPFAVHAPLSAATGVVPLQLSFPAPTNDKRGICKCLIQWLQLPRETRCNDTEGGNVCICAGRVCHWSPPTKPLATEVAAVTRLGGWDVWVSMCICVCTTYTLTHSMHVCIRYL